MSLSRDERVHADVHGLFRAHYLGLVRLAMRLVDDQESAEDLVQDVFVGLARHPAAMDDPVRYLRTAVVNRSRSALRKRSVARLFWSRHSAPGTGAPADEPALLHAARKQMLHAIAQLPRRQREVVVLRYYEDLSVTQISEVLNISPGAVSSALNRAMGALAPIMEDHDGD